MVSLGLAVHDRLMRGQLGKLVVKTPKECHVLILSIEQSCCQRLFGGSCHWCFWPVQFPSVRAGAASTGNSARIRGRIRRHAHPRHVQRHSRQVRLDLVNVLDGHGYALLLLIQIREGRLQFDRKLFRQLLFQVGRRLRCRCRRWAGVASCEVAGGRGRHDVRHLFLFRFVLQMLGGKKQIRCATNLNKQINH